MEKINFIRNGVLRLPPGFRFHPTDEELVVQYLKRKVSSFPLPASIIPEFDVCKSDPWDLPGGGEQERYFFSTRAAKYPNGNRSNRATGSGYWKATGIDKQIISLRSNKIVGMKKTLVFYRGKPQHGSRTDWIMHEYRLVDSETIPSNVNSDQTQNSAVLMENWVLCRIFLKKRGKKTSEDKAESCIEQEDPSPRTKAKPVFYDFLRKEGTDLNLAPSGSYSGSSGITMASNHESEENETSSSCNSPFSLRKIP